MHAVGSAAKRWLDGVNGAVEPSRILTPLRENRSLVGQGEQPSKYRYRGADCRRRPNVLRPVFLHLATYSERLRCGWRKTPASSCRGGRRDGRPIGVEDGVSPRAPQPVSRLRGRKINKAWPDGMSHGKQISVVREIPGSNNWSAKQLLNAPHTPLAAACQGQPNVQGCWVQPPCRRAWETAEPT